MRWPWTRRHRNGKAAHAAVRTADVQQEEADRLAAAVEQVVRRTERVVRRSDSLAAEVTRALGSHQ